jgi:hypothetical protein
VSYTFSGGGIAMSGSAWRHITGVLVGIAFLAALGGLFFSTVNQTALVSLLGIMAGALVLVSILHKIMEFSIGPGGVSGKVEHLETVVNRLNFLVTYLLTKPEREHLQRIASREVFEVNIRDNFWDGFRSEIRRLINLEFIGYDGRGRDLFDPDGPEVRRVDHYCTVTKSGEAYLKLFNEVKLAP